MKKIILIILSMAFFSFSLLPAYWCIRDLIIEGIFDFRGPILFAVPFAISLACFVNAVDLNKYFEEKGKKLIAKREKR